MGKSFLADIPGNFFVQKIGSVAAAASNGAGAIPADVAFVAPANIKLLSAWRLNQTASDVTAGTAISSASYRRMNLLNGGTAGTGTTIMASLNATASAASLTTRAFATTANNTATQGAILYASHLTVGAATADGTDLAASLIFIAYELL